MNKVNHIPSCPIGALSIVLLLYQYFKTGVFLQVLIVCRAGCGLNNVQVMKQELPVSNRELLVWYLVFKVSNRKFPVSYFEHRIRYLDLKVWYREAKVSNLLLPVSNPEVGLRNRELILSNLL